MSDVRFDLSIDVARRWVHASRVKLSDEQHEQLAAAIVTYDLRQADLRKQETQAAKLLRPLLIHAQAEGVYVRAAHVDRPEAHQHATPTTAFIAPPDSETYWAGGLRELHRQGMQTQLVYLEHERGVEVVGHRLSSVGDERPSISLAEVYAGDGRCKVCGMTREHYQTTTTPTWPQCHFPKRQHDWPDQLAA